MRSAEPSDWQLFKEAASRPLVWKTVVVIALLLVAAQVVFGKDADGRFVGSPLKSWFDGLRSQNGLCCSMADGSSVEDPDWEVKNGHYLVRLGGKWVDVPEKAVIREPNRAGRTMVWPVYLQETGEVVSIRCFLPGSMT